MDTFIYRCQKFISIVCQSVISHHGYAPFLSRLNVAGGEPAVRGTHRRVITVSEIKWKRSNAMNMVLLADDLLRRQH
jgi:hypothetical protein